MNLEMIVEGLCQLRLATDNAFLDRGEPCPIDPGAPGKEQETLDALGVPGWRLSDVRHILAAQLHADGSGGLRRLKRATGAQARRRPLDAEVVR